MKVPFKLRAQRAVDTFFEVVAPGHALKRHAYREQLKTMSTWSGRSTSYDGATTDRPRENWLPGSGSPDQDLLPDLPRLRERSRDLNRNEAVARGITDALVDNIIGTGIGVQSRLDPDEVRVSDAEIKEWQTSCERVWWDWAAKPDVTGRQSFSGLTRLACRSMFESGDVFAQPVMVPRVGRDLRLSLNLIEADRVDSPKTFGAPVTPFEYEDNKEPHMGVELGSLGEPKAYWVANQHPGLAAAGSKIRWTRIQAENSLGRPNLIHLYRQTRIGQSRGEPIFAPAMVLFDDFKGYREAELQSARVAACFSVFVKKLNPAASAAGRGTQRGSAVQDRRIEEIYPGMIEYLRPDEDISFGNPTRPSSAFDQFVVAVLRSIGAAVNLPYEVVAKDFSRTNYSSARASLLEARRMFRCWQQYFLDAWCQVLWEMVIEEAWLRGLLPNVPLFENSKAWMRAHWTTPGWGSIDPTKEVAAAKDSIQAGLSSLADECASNGKDWEEVLRQREREEKTAKTLNLTLTSSGQNAKAVTPNPATPQEDDAEEEEDADEAELVEEPVPA